MIKIRRIMTKKSKSKQKRRKKRREGKRNNGFGKKTKIKKPKKGWGRW